MFRRETKNNKTSSAYASCGNYGAAICLVSRSEKSRRGVGDACRWSKRTPVPSEV